MSSVAEKINRSIKLSPDRATERLVTFYQAYPYSLPAMRADKTALGSLPVKAHQYCEAIRTASGLGWYVFPATDLQLCFDGVDTFWATDDSWQKLTVEYLPDADQWWKPNCPESLADMEPPFVTSLGIPGYVQIWSGLLIKTRPDWSSHIRPIANLPGSNQFFCFEGIVETDNYSPMPLFINLKLQKTDVAINFAADEPLFQVQAIHRSSYSIENQSSYDTIDISRPNCKNASEFSEVETMTELDWQGYSKTVRPTDASMEEHQSGDYAKTCRKRAKAGV